MLGIMVGVTRRTVTVGIPQVQFSDLVVVPGVQRQASGPDSAAPCVPTTSGAVGLRAEQIRLKEYVDRTLGGLDDSAFSQARILPLCHLLVPAVDVFTDSDQALVVGRGTATRASCHRAGQASLFVLGRCFDRFIRHEAWTWCPCPWPRSSRCN